MFNTRPQLDQLRQSYGMAALPEIIETDGVGEYGHPIRKPIGPIRQNPQTRSFLLDVMREVVAVGRAHGVDLAEDYALARLELADSVAPDMTSSMHHDLDRGNPLEVRWLAGGVVELGLRKGVPTPLNRAIADILALHASGAGG